MKYKIQMSNGWIRKDYLRGLEEGECLEILDALRWKYEDENGFVWDMDYVEE